MLKILIRTLAMAALSAGLIYLLIHFGWMDLHDLEQALARHSLWVGLALAGQVAIAAVSIVRYGLALRESQVVVSGGSVAAASLISQAIGQWFSGSLAIMEAVRFGVMLGDDSQAAEGRRRVWQLRLVTASLFERLIGQATMLVAGGLAALVVVVCETDTLRAPLVWYALIGVSLGGGLVLGLLPVAPKLPFCQRLIPRFTTLSASKRLPRVLGKMLAAVLGLVRKSADAQHGVHFSRLWWTQVALSLALWLVTALTFYFNLRAAEATVSFVAVAAGLPLMAVASIVPLGFAGFGGNQLVTVAVLGLLSEQSQQIIAASLLSNAVTLLVQTMLGLMAFGRCHRLVVDALRKSRGGTVPPLAG